MPALPHLRLGVNIDHVATVRNARGGRHPDPVRAAQIAIAAGADGITAHLREDRRHIRDDDIARLKAEIAKPLNLEMAATEEMMAIALKHKPHAACIVPEKREERTTEGGLDVARLHNQVAPYVTKLRDAITRMGIHFPVVVDDKQKIFRDYLCDLWPSQFVIDRNGIVRYSHGGVGRYSDMEEVVQQLLK